MNKLSEYPQDARTSYFGDQIKLSLNDVLMYFGEPTYKDSMDEKVQYEWVFKGEDGNVFTLYDWKQSVILHDQPIAWHIGASSRMASLEGRNELIESIHFCDQINLSLSDVANRMQKLLLINSEIKSMAVELSKDYGIKLSKSDKFNALPQRYQTMIRKEVYNNLINTDII